MPDRLSKVNELLKIQVGKLLLTEVEFADGVLVTVMGASVSPTLEHATIYISVLPSQYDKVAMAIIKKNIASLQHQLNKTLKMRTVPKLMFKVDHTEEHAAHIEEILEKEVQ